MKKIVCWLGLVGLMASYSVFAMEYNPGPYIGGQAGWGRVIEGKGYGETADLKNIELGEFMAHRLYVGYSFSTLFSVESGFSYFPFNTYTKADGTNIEVKTYNIDFMGKLIMPFSKVSGFLSHFSIYGKGGVAYVHTIISDTINTSASSQEKTTTASIRPAYGAGIIFNFTDNIAVDASWMGVIGKNRVTSSADVVGGKPVPGSNLFMLGVSYKITGL